MAKLDKPQAHRKLFENIKAIIYEARNAVASNINVYSKSETLSRISQRTFSETDLRTAIINRIKHFMLELGKGFLFAGRQVRFSFDEEHYYVDLVFYNRLLKCFVLIDLKIGKLKHQDTGQMQMYVNYYDRYVKAEDENRTIGIILCKDKKKAMVEITLPENNEQIFARKYQLYLPIKEELQRQLEE